MLKIEWHELFTGNWKQEKYFNFPPKHKRHNPTNRCRWRPSFGAKEKFLSPKYNVWVQSIIFSTALQLLTSKCHKYVNICFWRTFFIIRFCFSYAKEANSLESGQSSASPEFTWRWIDLFTFLLLNSAPPAIYHVFSPSACWPSSSCCTPSPPSPIFSLG